MLSSARTLKHEDSLQADVCIAGAGAAGITLARELETSGLEVLLLESGGFEPESKTQALYQGDSVGQEYWALHTTRLRYFGGSTNHWTGWCRPLDPVDFEAQPGNLGGWPISYSDLVPHYLEAQKDCQLADFQYSARAWSERYAVPLIELGDDAWETVAWQFSPPTRFGEQYRKALVEHPRLKVLTHANLTHVSLDRTGHHVNAFKLACLEGPHFEVRARAFVLCLGGLENARVMLASNDVAPAGVGNQHDVVGRYFSDHPHSVVGQIVLSAHQPETGYTGPTRRGDGTSVRFSWALSDTARRDLGLPGMSVCLDLLPDSPDSRLANLASLGVSSLLEELIERPTKYRHALFLRAEQPLTRTSRVKLARHRDSLGMPCIALDWRLPRGFQDQVARAVELLALGVGRQSVGRVLSFAHAETPPKTAWPLVWGGHHHIGTTRMSDDPRYGVVDSDCKVHGVDNLYCAGSSVFSTAGYANPTLTICALARRLGGHLKGCFA